jgi:cytochrome c-type protein NapC
VAALVIAGFVGGIIFWGGFNTAMEATNTIAFCTGCHEMRDNVYQEYQGTVHDVNRTGVRAICSDCHVPKDWVHKIARKIRASNEVYHWLAGTVNTKEKFEAHRMQLATHVWAGMKETDSRECRNCHSFTAMNPAKQTPRAQKAHARAQTEGKTCIDCHKGIAHLLPREYEEEDN